MDRLAKLTAGELLSSGIFPGLLGEAAPLWTEGENVIFDNEGVRKTNGLLGLSNVLVTPTGLKATYASSEARCFVGAGTEAYRYRASDGLTNIGSFASSGGIYQFVPWDTWCLISNGVDPVELWQNAGASAAITAPFTYANTIFKYQLQAFAAGTSNGGNYVEWSPVNAVTDWTTSATGTAGNLLLRELEGDIVAARPIGGSIGIYSRAQGGVFSFIGGTSIYGFRRPILGVGAISPYSVVAVGDRHFGFTRENVFTTDLVSFLLIDEPAMRRYVEQNADWDRLQEVYGWPDWANNIVRWAIPKVGGGKFGVGFRWDRGTWTKFNDGVLLGEESGAFADMLQVKTTRLLRADKTTGNNDGLEMTSYAQTKPLDFGNRDKIKHLSKISLDGSWAGTVELSVGVTDHPNTAPTWVLTTALANEIYPDSLGQRIESPFFSFRIASSGTGATWRISGVEIWGERAGNVS